MLFCKIYWCGIWSWVRKLWIAVKRLRSWRDIWYLRQFLCINVLTTSERLSSYHLQWYNFIFILRRPSGGFATWDIHPKRILHSNFTIIRSSMLPTEFNCWIHVYRCDALFKAAWQFENILWVNSIWRDSSLRRVSDRYPISPSHYLNQCCNIIDRTYRNKLQWNLNQNVYILI